MIGIAICVGLGTWAGVVLGGAGTALAGVIIFGIISLAAHASKQEYSAQSPFCVLLVSGAMLLAARQQDQSIAALLSRTGTSSVSRVELLGQVTSDVVEIPGRSASGLVRFSVQAESVRLDGVEHYVRDAVRINMSGAPRYPPVYGETWKMTGRLSQQRGRKRRGRARYTLNVGLRDTRCVKRTDSAFMAWCFDARTHAAAMLSAGIEDSPDVCAVVNALLLGYRAQLPYDVKDCFMHTGTMHVFAISGLHVGILCSVIVFVLGVFRVPRTAWVLALAPLIVTYTSVTGARASAIRASAMMIAYLLAPLVRRRADAVSAFALAGVAILLWLPEQLFDMGFLYSFSVVAGIMAIVPIFDRLLSPMWRSDPFAIREMTEKGGWRRNLLKGVLRTLSVSLAAWLTSAPLSLYFFGRFCPIALLGNCLAIPLAFLILVTSCLSITAGSVFALPGEVFNHANWCFVRLLVKGMKTLERIPYGWVECERMPLFMVVIWYAVLISGVVLLRRRRKS
jgi:ComEC/Rec2-related protein